MKRVVAAVVVLLVAATGLALSAAESAAQEGTSPVSLERRCPTGYIEIPVDDPTCARFEFAREGDPTCPLDAEGVPETGCYVYYGERAQKCPIDGVALEGTCMRVVDSAPVCLTPDSCYEVVDKDATGCWAQTVLVPVAYEPGFACRDDVTLMSQLICQPGFSLWQGECFLRLTPGPSCAEGLVLIYGSCRLRGEPPVVGPKVCPRANDIIADGCYRLAPPIYKCPADTDLERKGDCLRAVEPLAGDFACSGGERLVDEQCLVPYDPVGPFTCGGEYLAGMCVVYGDPAIPGPRFCPSRVGVFEDEFSCYVKVELLADGSCEPPGYLAPTDSPDHCREEVALLSYSLDCEAGHVVVANDCAAAAGVVFDPSYLHCTENALVDALGNCRKPVANAQPPFVCDDPASLVLNDACAWIASPRIWCEGLPEFTDVRAGAFFEDPVGWAGCVGVTTGTTTSTFSPDAPVTRAQLATLLWRYAGKPAGAPAHGFSDVPAGSYFDQAVAWLKQQGITTGTAATTFSPQAPVTRAQMAAFLWRMEGEPVGAAHFFLDVPTEAYFDTAVGWMADQQITTGTSASTFSPQSSLTRGQTVTFLWRLAGKPG